MKTVNSGGPGQNDSRCVRAFPRPTPLDHSVHILTGLLWPHWEEGDLILDQCRLHPLILHMAAGEM